MKKTFILFCVSLFLITCKKYAGDGGNSSISGNVMKDIRVILANSATYQRTVPGADRNVFIIYGDHTSPDDNVDTNYDGEFEFRYLRPGKYTIYVYSKDTNAVAVAWDENHMLIKHEVEITEKKQNQEVSAMTIYDTN